MRNKNQILKDYYSNRLPKAKTGLTKTPKCNPGEVNINGKCVPVNSEEYRKAYESGIGRWVAYDENTRTWKQSDASNPNAQWTSSPKTLSNITVNSKVNPYISKARKQAFEQVGSFDDFRRKKEASYPSWYKGTSMYNPEKDLADQKAEYDNLINTRLYQNVIDAIPQNEGESRLDYIDRVNKLAGKNTVNFAKQYGLTEPFDPSNKDLMKQWGWKGMQHIGALAQGVYNPTMAPYAMAQGIERGNQPVSGLTAEEAKNVGVTQPFETVDDIAYDYMFRPGIAALDNAVNPSGKASREIAQRYAGPSETDRIFTSIFNPINYIGPGELLSGGKNLIRGTKGLAEGVNVGSDVSRAGFGNPFSKSFWTGESAVAEVPGFLETNPAYVDAYETWKKTGGFPTGDLENAANRILDKVHTGEQLTTREYDVYENLIANTDKYINNWKTSRLKWGHSTPDVLPTPKKPKGYVVPPMEISDEVSPIFKNQADIEHNGKKFYLNKDNPTEIFVDMGDGTIQRADNADIPRVQEKYSATLPKETTPVAPKPEPVQQTTAATETKPTAQPQDLQQQLAEVRRQNAQNPPSVEPAAPVTDKTGKKVKIPWNDLSNWGKTKRAVGYGLGSGIGLGAVTTGIVHLMNGQDDTKLPFVNRNENQNVVGPGNDSVPSVLTNQTTTPVLDTNNVTVPDTNNVAVPNLEAMTDAEWNNLIDTANVPQQRYGGIPMANYGYSLPDWGSGYHPNNSPSFNLRLPQQTAQNSSLNPYAFYQKGNQYNSTFGGGFNYNQGRMNVNAGMSMNRFNYPGFSGYSRPQYNVGVGYRFDLGGNVSISGLQSALKRIKI